MEDHRQIVTLRQPELRVEDRLLAFKLRILAIEIEADLTDGDKFVSCGLQGSSSASMCSSRCRSITIGCRPSAA
jgi:hypothetical protein